MDSNFWTLLDEYKRMKKGDVIKSDQSNFVNDYHAIHKVVHAKMYGPDTRINGEPGSSIFGEYVGADDGHDDLIDFLIWNGKETVNKFLQDPRSAIPLAKRMSRNPLFDGDVNIMKRLTSK